MESKLDRTTSIFQTKIDQIGEPLMVTTGSSEHNKAELSRAFVALGIGQPQSRIALSEIESELMLSLSPRQHAICQLVVAGWTNEEIAREFGLTENAVKSYVRYITVKLDLKSRTQIASVYRDMSERLQSHEYKAITCIDQEFAKRWRTGVSLPEWPSVK